MRSPANIHIRDTASVPRSSDSAVVFGTHTQVDAEAEKKKKKGKETRRRAAPPSTALSYFRCVFSSPGTHAQHFGPSPRAEHPGAAHTSQTHSSVVANHSMQHGTVKPYQGKAHSLPCRTPAPPPLVILVLSLYLSPHPPFPQCIATHARLEQRRGGDDKFAYARRILSPGPPRKARYEAFQKTPRQRALSSRDRETAYAFTREQGGGGCRSISSVSSRATPLPKRRLPHIALSATPARTQTYTQTRPVPFSPQHAEKNARASLESHTRIRLAGAPSKASSSCLAQASGRRSVRCRGDSRAARRQSRVEPTTGARQTREWLGRPRRPIHFFISDLHAR